MMNGCAPGAPDDPAIPEDGEDKVEGLAANIYTAQGWLSVEDDYVARVCTQENGSAPYEALKAQAIAARTYLYRAMRDDPSLGTPSNPVPNGESFQTFAAAANSECAQAASETRGVLARYDGTITIANYVAGALVNSNGSLGSDWSGTEKWVTYNEGLTGTAVRPTKLSYTARIDNRGCMGQNRAAYLAAQGYDYASILRYFYGADLEIDEAPSASAPAVADVPEDECGGIDYAGLCEGSVLTWCEGGSLHTHDCASAGLTCAYQNDWVGYNCL